MATSCILAVLLQMAACTSGHTPHTRVVRPYSGYHLNTGIQSSVDGDISRSGDINITVNVFSSGLFRKKETLGWHPDKRYGSRQVCEAGKCFWLPSSPLVPRRPSLLRYDGDKCCAANLYWIIPQQLQDSTGRWYPVFQYDPFYQGYTGVHSCSNKSCPGSCNKGVTSVTFIVWDAQYLIAKSFEVETYCLCH